MQSSSQIEVAKNGKFTQNYKSKLYIHVFCANNIKALEMGAA